jgi:uncharacterized membrane protein
MNLLGRVGMHRQTRQDQVCSRARGHPAADRAIPRARGPCRRPGLLFRRILRKRVAFGGFVVIAVGVLLGIYKSFVAPAETRNAAYLASLAGVLTQFISSVFFYFHNRTLQQFNLFSDKLAETQDSAISLLANSSIIDQTKRDDCRAELVKQVLGMAPPPPPPPAAFRANA